MTKFTVNNKAHSATKVFLFMVNYSRELGMGVDIKRKGKMEKTAKFAERMKKIQEEVGVVLRKIQEKIK